MRNVVDHMRWKARRQVYSGTNIITFRWENDTNIITLSYTDIVWVLNLRVRAWSAWLFLESRSGHLLFSTICCPVACPSLLTYFTVSVHKTGEDSLFDWRNRRLIITILYLLTLHLYTFMQQAVITTTCSHHAYLSLCGATKYSWPNSTCYSVAQQVRPPYWVRLRMRLWVEWSHLTGGWRKLLVHAEELHNAYSSPVLLQ
jgi:hypothetical protein